MKVLKYLVFVFIVGIVVMFSIVVNVVIIFIYI